MKNSLKKGLPSQKQALHPAFIGTLFFPSTSDETNVPRESYRRFQQIPTTRHSGKTDVSRLLIHQSLLTTLCIALYLLTASHSTVPDQNVYKAQMTPRIPATQEQAFDMTSAASVPIQVCPTNPKSPIKLDKQMMNLRRKWESRLSQSHRELQKSFHLWRQVMPIFQQDQCMTFTEAVLHYNTNSFPKKVPTWTHRTVTWAPLKERSKECLFRICEAATVTPKELILAQIDWC